ncbi:MAG: nucleotidyltransferase domain-containing protein [Tepidiformaceae bacterium]
MQPPPNHQGLIDRFTAACQQDERVAAAFLAGSYARGTADTHSDVDLGIITTDADHERFAAEKLEFARGLGEALFLEDFGSTQHLFLILSDGTECDITLGRESDFRDMNEGAYHVLVDKSGLLDRHVFPWRARPEVEQREALRRLLAWFWHDFGHLVKALERDELWFAQGELEILRGLCVNLARLRHNFADPYTGDEPYFKVEAAMPAHLLDALRGSFGLLDRASLIRSAGVVLPFYQDAARELAAAHDLAYPARLDALFAGRLARLGDS